MCNSSNSPQRTRFGIGFEILCCLFSKQHKNNVNTPGYRYFFVLKLPNHLLESVMIAIIPVIPGLYQMKNKCQN